MTRWKRPRELRCHEGAAFGPYDLMAVCGKTDGCGGARAGIHDKNSQPAETGLCSNLADGLFEALTFGEDFAAHAEEGRATGADVTRELGMKGYNEAAGVEALAAEW